MINHPNRSRRIVPTAEFVAPWERPKFYHDGAYLTFSRMVQDTFRAAVASGRPLFTTHAVCLWERYLDALPASDRQYYNCRCCRHFIERFGSLVTINDDGNPVSAIWPARDVPAFFREAARRMVAAVEVSFVDRPFLTNTAVLGTPVTDVWEHLSVKGAPIYRHSLLTPGQAAAAKVEDFKNVRRALGEFSVPVLKEALRVLEADAVNRAERFVAPVRWLLNLHEARQHVGVRQRDNLLWAAVATAPEGFCHPRSSVIGTLLEDVYAGLSFEEVRNRFNAKMHPLRYQRPQAAPRAGNIAVAEKLVEKLGIERSLERRFARLDEIETIWRPRTPERRPVQATSGVFSQVTPREATEQPRRLALPATTMTWEKFSRTVLPTATEIEVRVPTLGNFSALLTARWEDAPPIIVWDHPERRNPFSSYVYHRGSTAESWGLVPDTWWRVTAIHLRPNLWGGDPKPHLGEGGTFILDRAIDSRTNSGNALFPEILRPELREVRSVIESYSKTAMIHGRAEGSACGLAFSKGDIGIKARALSDGGWTTCLIDRWD